MNHALPEVRTALTKPITHGHFDIGAEDGVGVARSSAVAQPIVKPQGIVCMDGIWIGDRCQMHIEREDVFGSGGVVDTVTTTRIGFKLRVNSMANQNKALAAPIGESFGGLIAT